MELVLGGEVMVMFNVSTDLDMENEARGHTVDMVLDKRELEAPEKLTVCECSILLSTCSESDTGQ